jgi:hypothetical protein
MVLVEYLEKCPFYVYMVLYPIFLQGVSMILECYQYGFVPTGVCSCPPLVSLVPANHNNTTVTPL